ncbi:unnamed protein product, partial [Meganyctiphanes norvegica]
DMDSSEDGATGGISMPTARTRLGLNMKKAVQQASGSSGISPRGVIPQVKSKAPPSLTRMRMLLRLQKMKGSQLSIDKDNEAAKKHQEEQEKAKKSRTSTCLGSSCWSSCF